MTLRHVWEKKTRRGVVTVEEHETMRAAVDRLVHGDIGALVVVSEGNPVGIVTERDVLRQVAANGAAFLTRPVSDVMTSDVIVGTLDDEIDLAERIMTQRHFRHLPIVDRGKLAGIVTLGDIVKAQSGAAEVEVHYLRDYIAGRYR